MPRGFLFLLFSFYTLVAGAGDTPPVQDSSARQNPQRTTSEAEGQEKAGKQNPFTSPSDVNQGRNFFHVLCSRCHGRNARGGKGPDLTDGVFRYALTDEEIRRIIGKGIPGTDMAGFEDGTDIWLELSWQMVAYLRSEETKRGAKKAKPPAGDLAHGAKLFQQFKCASCHWTGAEGGRRGTNLSRLSVSTDYVVKSLIDPDSQINADFQLLQIVMENGQVVTGRWLSENSYFILLMDDEENLRTIRKSRIEILNRPHKSLMPSYKRHLTTADIEDLTTYIFSLQKGPSK